MNIKYGRPKTNAVRNYFWQFGINVLRILIVLHYFHQWYCVIFHSSLPIMCDTQIHKHLTECFYNSRIRETPNISTDVHTCTNTGAGIIILFCFPHPPPPYLIFFLLFFFFFIFEKKMSTLPPHCRLGWTREKAGTITMGLVGQESRATSASKSPELIR